MEEKIKRLIPSTLIFHYIAKKFWVPFFFAMGVFAALVGRCFGCFSPLLFRPSGGFAFGVGVCVGVHVKSMFNQLVCWSQGF